MTAKEVNEVYIIDDAPASTNTGINVSAWNSLKTAAGTLTFPSAMGNPYDKGAVAEKPKFCNYCGHPLVRGKVVGREYSPTTGLMFGKWSMFGCETKRWLLKHPRLMKLRHKLNMHSKHTMNVLTEKFNEKDETWEHWSNIDLSHWFKNRGQGTW